MRAHTSLSLISLALAFACSGVSHDPRQVALEFWEAGKTGDTERARAYVSASSQAKITDKEDAGSSIGDVTLDEATVDGDEATVGTTMTNVTDQGSMEVEFLTHLVREEGDWKIDLDKTTNDMMKSMLGVTMNEMAEQMGKAMGDAMGKAMQGMAEGMAEGMKTMADSLDARSDKRQR